MSGSFELNENVEHAVIVHFNCGQPSLDPPPALEDKLRAVVTLAEDGEYDGNEIDIDLKYRFPYIFEPEAYKLNAFVAPILEGSFFIFAQSLGRELDHQKSMSGRDF